MKYLSQLQTISQSKFINYLAYTLLVLFIIAGIVVSLHRYWQYEVFFYDFGIFDQAIWLVSNFQAPVIDHYVIGGKWIFADHFSPGIFLLSPLYWFSDRSEILLIAQAIIVGLSGLVLYFIGVSTLKNKLLALSVLVAYLTFIGLQNAVITDFHEVTISTLPLMLTFYAFVKKNKLLFIFFLLLTLSFKESLFLLGIGIGIAIVLLDRSWWRIGAIAMIMSLLWGIVSIKFIIPYFSGGFYQYSTPIPSSATNLISAFFDNPIKQRTMFYSFFQFNFLPLLSPAFWFLIFQDFLVRFYPEWSTRWGLGLHYSAQLSVILAVSSVFILRQLQAWRKTKRFITVASFLFMANSLVLYAFVLRAPFALAYNRAFYNHTKEFKFLDQLTQRVPSDASVMTHNNLAVRYTHQKMWLLRESYSQYMPEYILIDNRDGQGPNNFFGSGEMNKIINDLLSDPAYVKVYTTDNQFIFKRVQ